MADQQNWRLGKARSALNDVFIDPEASAEEIVAAFGVLMEDCEMYIEQCSKADEGAGIEEEG